jgi:protein required for attachment to host cells
MQQSSVTWVLISDASRARLFQAGEYGAHQMSLTLLRKFEHPESRERNLDLVSDKPGRIQQSVSPNIRMRGGSGGGQVATGNRAGMEPTTPPKKIEHEHFARELAQELEKGLQQNAYSNLIVAANPEFLGLLRGTMSDQVKKHLTASLDKDYTAMDVRELEGRISGMLPS